MSSVGGAGGVQKVEVTRFEQSVEQRNFVKGSLSIEGKIGSRKELQSYFDISKLKEEDKKKLEVELKKMNESLVSAGKVLKFKYNEEANETYVEVIDAESQKVVASLPPEFLIDLSIKMKELIGMFIDKKM